MWKANFTIVVMLLSPAFSFVQAATMAERMKTCTASCHGPSLIAQQRLDREAWVREIDKMMRWGAEVPAAEKDAFINFLASLFNPSRPRPATNQFIREAKGSDIFQISCMGCHDASVIAGAKRNASAWNQQIDRMISWGAYVPAERKEDLVQYLTTAF